MKQYLSFIIFGLGIILCACVGRTPTPTIAPPSGGAIVVPGEPQIIIFSPQENSVVNAPQVEITGQAAPGTVITFDDEIVVVDQSGQFAVTVPLDEGPNAIQMVASDAEGNETTFELTVTYDAQG